MVNIPPLVSIIMCTWNSDKYISEAINSVLNQTYGNWELIIINDASSDNTKDIISKYITANNEIIYLENKINLWVSISRNKWIELSKWKYIAILDSDDIWFPNKLEKQIEFLEKNNDYWLVWTNVIRIDENGNSLWKFVKKETDTAIRKNLIFANQFCHSSILFRKSALDQVGFYDEKIPLSEDYDLFLRIWTVSKLYNIQEYLTKYRIHDSNISKTRKLHLKWIAYKFFFRYRKKYNAWCIDFVYATIVFLLPQNFIRYLSSILK